MIACTVYPSNDDTAIEFEVDFVSFVNHDTYGKPAIIAPGTEDFTRAQDFDHPVRVLYVNTQNIAAMEAVKYP